MEESYRILKYFKYEHLPHHLQVVSRPLCELAHRLASGEDVDWVVIKSALPESTAVVDSEEWEVARAKLLEVDDASVEEEIEDALRKLLEAKDAAVRSVLP